MPHQRSGRGRAEFRGNNNVPVIRVNLKQLKRMLSGSTNSSCIRLSRDIKLYGCEIVAGIHQGGLGGSGFGADPRPHITVRVNGDTYHVHINKFGIATDVT
jgi:hypothetical protein